MQNNAAEEVDPLSSFILNGSQYYEMVRDETSFTSVEALRKAYANHCAFVLHEQHAYKADEALFKRLGLLLKRIHLCTTCEMVASKEGCDKHYNTSARQRAYVVWGLRMNTLKDSPSRKRKRDEEAEAEEKTPSTQGVLLQIMFIGLPNDLNLSNRIFHRTAFFL